MKFYQVILAAAVLSLFAAYSYSQDAVVVTTTKPTLPLVNWTVTSGEEIKIENGNGTKLLIQITVHGTENSPGITLKNCGQTNAIKAGSSVICTSQDAVNPVTFTSDNATEPAKGTYQITQE